jgi:hypothetical protein
VYQITESDLDLLSRKFDETMEEFGQIALMNDQMIGALEQSFNSSVEELRVYQSETRLFKQQLAELSSIRSALNCQKS